MEKTIETFKINNFHKDWGFTFRFTVKNYSGMFIYSIFFLSQKAKQKSLPPFIHNNDVMYDSLNECIVKGCEDILKGIVKMPLPKQLEKELRNKRSIITEPQQTVLF